jgi:hypothetical protein
MGIMFTTYLAVGVRVDEKDFPGSVFDDRWIQYSEGRAGVEIRILQGQASQLDDGSCPIYIGKVIASWSRHDNGDGFKAYIPTADDFMVVDQFIEDNFCHEGIGDSAKLMFFTIAS